MKWRRVQKNKMLIIIDATNSKFELIYLFVIMAIPKITVYLNMHLHDIFSTRNVFTVSMSFNVIIIICVIVCIWSIAALKEPPASHYYPYVRAWKSNQLISSVFCFLNYNIRWRCLVVYDYDTPLNIEMLSPHFAIRNKFQLTVSETPHSRAMHITQFELRKHTQVTRAKPLPFAEEESLKLCFVFFVLVIVVVRVCVCDLCGFFAFNGISKFSSFFLFSLPCTHK